MSTLTLLSRPGCHLCEQVTPALKQLAADDQLEFETVNIAEDAELERKYAFVIPVVLLDGAKIAQAPIRMAALRLMLEEALAHDRALPGG